MSVEIQKRIKDDQEDVQAYMEELNSWESEIVQKDEDLKKKAANSIAAFPPVRGTKESEIPRMSEKEEKALQEKELGNTAFKRGKLEVALRHYTKSLEYWPGSAVVYSNRAQVFLKQKEWNSANKDASTAIKLTSSAVKEQCNNDNAKAYYRRAVARHNLGLYNQAKADLQAILAFDPMHKEARNELKKVEDAIRKVDEELEEKKGRKKLVIEEVDDDDDDDNGAQAAGGAASPQKKGKSVVIEEVDDDDDEEDVPVTIKETAAASPAPKPTPKPIPKPAPKPTPKPTPKPAVPFKPKTAAEVKRGGPMIIEEIESDDEEVVPVPIKKSDPKPQPAKEPAPKVTKVAIEEVDDEEDEEEEVPMKKSWQTPKTDPPAPKSADPCVPPSTVNKPTSKELPAKAASPPPPADRPTKSPLADRAPTNFFEFDEVWRELRKDDALLTTYLLKIEATSYKTLFKSSLSYDVIQDVIRCFDKNLGETPSEDASYHALRVLYNLSQVPRFGELVMFLSKEDKSRVDSLFAKASASGLAEEKVKKARAKLASFGL
uniref:RNA polymerase II-associated protein 3 n=1 Tax=Eutreptiella gymnastica TaxID=73025 RepID=A0A7S4FNM6_9EUGL|mmetsp:Transcript_25315/g.43251  ORF Transcript_25315/g.43251 Transcript_25315/m.43251 type:complete len:546 (-) Transcript_25315:189-1826(-)|eukprot:CAMPEP_0174321526 /NCGR_PEP_ID=MMETSP0810-20121108/10376_1 /TAXON_ID=73025 ORGANISM="Eutreptiella gymnastica-like, Strain CCMP1594" /NCGR_SAMPLE_ID=MMETSP0810 /ASSEMBLY_ACC=CAM_ASM_000659 /LENGTH=545 /DNA_ID=CAMNT_0015433003 /DNA_START=33 /DNA_END=1670 /DNA_ORIENTATION=-